jgi:hypothetical protein
MSDARTYADAQGLHHALSTAVKEVLIERPVDAIQRVAEILLSQTKSGGEAKMAPGADGNPAKEAAVVSFGIAGTSEIGPKVIPALRDVSNSRLIGVGSRDVARAKEYCTKNNAGEGQAAQVQARKALHHSFSPTHSQSDIG